MLATYCFSVFFQSSLLVSLCPLTPKEGELGGAEGREQREGGV